MSDSAIDWEYAKLLFCRAVRDSLLSKLRELHESCFQDGALKSLSERCVALYVLYYLDRNRYYASLEELVAYLKLPREAEPALRKIWREGLGEAERKRAPKVLGNWLWSIAKDVALGYL